MTDRDAATLSHVVDTLCESAIAPANAGTPSAGVALPSRETISEVVSALRAVLFPGYFGDAPLGHEPRRFFVGATLDRALVALVEQVKRGLCFAKQNDPAARVDSACLQSEEEAGTVVRAFMRRLPAVQALLVSDVRAAYEGDPALHSAAEAIFCYPGMMAITNARIAHELFTQGVPLIPRMITELAHSVTGVDIHPGAQIGASFFIDHGTGVVIGETCVIGERVRLYQGVTLGAKSFPLDGTGKPIKGIARHPVVEDDVIIYAGATILGRVTIGRGATIGGNVWLTEDVPAGARVLASTGIAE